jgi:hypothetical protein
MAILLLLLLCSEQVAVTVAGSNKKYRVGELNNFLRDIGETTLVCKQHTKRSNIATTAKPAIAADALCNNP